MDRKLFLSYVQNMQQNNPDMIGFQNSITKNSWQKPRSIVEMNGGGSVNQGAFDRKDAERQKAKDSAKRALQGIDFEAAAKEAHGDIMAMADEHAAGQEIHSFEHNPKGFHDPKETFVRTTKEGKKIGAVDASAFLEGDKGYSAIRSMASSSTDSDLEAAHDAFIDALNAEHASYMGTQKMADEQDQDQDEIDMTTDAFEKQRRYESYNRLSEAVLRTGTPSSYMGGTDNVPPRQITRRHKAGEVLTALMDPNHPINNDPAHADERESLIRALTDMGYFPNKHGGINYGRVSGGRDMEFLGAPANDPTRTGPGTLGANVQDLRRYAEFANKRIYNRVYGGPTPPGFMPPTNQ